MKIKNRIDVYLSKLKENNFISKLLKNMIISFIGEGGAAFVAFFSTIILIYLIGNKNYGIIAVSYTFVTIVDSFVNFQAWHAMIAFGSESIANRDYKSLEKLIKIGSIIDFSTAVLGTVIAIFSARFFGNLLGWNKETISLIYILSFVILFNFTGTSIGIIRLLDKFKLFSIYRIITELIRFILIIVFCGILDMGLYGAAYAFAGGYISGYLILFFMFINTLRIDKNISIRNIFKSNIKSDWKKVFNFTFWTSMTSSADIPVQQFDVIFLSLLSYEIVAVFKVYKQIGQLLTKFATPLKQAIMPLFSELITKKQYVECYSYFRKIKKRSFQMIFPLIILITISSLVFMSISLEKIYLEYWYILLLYLILRGMALAYSPIHPFFIALGQVKKNFSISLFANISYVFIVWITIRHIGIWSILLGLLIEYSIVITLKSYVVKEIVQSKTRFA